MVRFLRARHFEEACEQPQLDTHWWNAFSPFNLLSSMTLQYLQGSSPRRFRREGEVWGVLASFHVLGQAAWPIMFTFHLGTVPICSNGRARSQTRSWLIAEAHQEDARSERCPSRKRTQSGSILGASYFPATWYTVAAADCVKGNLSWKGWILTYVRFKLFILCSYFILELLHLPPALNIHWEPFLFVIKHGKWEAYGNIPVAMYAHCLR